MLVIKPSCEQCNKPLAPNSTEARICSFECTFCVDCVNKILENVCPNCGGNFTPRPIRPKAKLVDTPASTEVVHKAVDKEKHSEYAAPIKGIKPRDR